MVPEIISRIEARVPDLSGRVQATGDFVAMIRDNKLPQQDAAFVIAAGMTGGQPSAMAGLFVQPVTETIGVALVFRTLTSTAGRKVPDIRDRILAVIEALAGWAPGDEAGVLTLARVIPLGLTGGTALYEVDFTLDDQLRITP